MSPFCIRSLPDFCWLFTFVSSLGCVNLCSHLPCTFDGWVPILDFFNMVLSCGLLGTKSCKSSVAFFIQCRVNCFAGTLELMAEMKKNITSLLNFFFFHCDFWRWLPWSILPVSAWMSQWAMHVHGLYNFFHFILLKPIKKIYCQKEVYRENHQA